MKSILFKFTFIFFTVGSIAACSSSDNSNQNKSGIEYTSEYVCPMHCEGSGSDSADLCPVCGMDYVQNTSKQEKN